MFSVNVPRTLMFQKVEKRSELPESLAIRDKYEEGETGEEQNSFQMLRESQFGATQVLFAYLAVIRALRRFTEK